MIKTQCPEPFLLKLLWKNKLDRRFMCRILVKVDMSKAGAILSGASFINRLTILAADKHASLFGGIASDKGKR